MNIFGNSLAMSGKSLDYLWAKQQTTLNNIANAETPGYKAKYVTFEEAFKSKLEAAGSKTKAGDAIKQSHYTVHKSTGESSRLDGNSVQVDVENVELARTGLQYQYELQSVNSDITRLRTAIKGQ